MGAAQFRRRFSNVLLVAVIMALALSLSRVGRADTLESARKRGVVVWGADAEGGAPYVFPRDDDPNRVTGFEVDLADALGSQLRVRAEFAQGNWDKLPDLLKAEKVDLVLNGYEWTPLRAELMESSIPYFVYGLQLLARANDGSIASWKDLETPKRDGSKYKVGVLAGSAADLHVTELFGSRVDIERYDGNTDVMRETETGKLDACVQDSPIATFYASRFPSLHPVGAPTAEGYYVIYARKGDTQLVRAIDEAIVRLWKRGDLERIYRRYGIWDGRQEKIGAIVESSKFFGLADVANAEAAPVDRAPATTLRLGAKPHGFEVVRDYAKVMVESAGMTVVLAVLSFPIAIVLGMLVAIGRLYGPSWVRAPLTAYVEFLRGTPLMLQLYFVFFFLPELGIRIPAFATAVTGLAINYSAYESEVYRAGLQAIPPGQMEAALSLGMPRAMAIRRILVPQAARMVIPPVVNDFIALFKDTSVCSVVTIIELTKRYSILSMSTQATVELMLMTAVLYLMMSYPLSLVARRLELRLGQGARA
jgi:polar amino acid transport system substrate-binding protein